MNLRLVIPMCFAAAVLAHSSAAGAVVLQSVPGTITALAADNRHLAYTTNLNTAACPAPRRGPRQQVVYLDARWKTPIVLTTRKGCATSSGPGYGVAAGPWLGVTGAHVFWIAGSSRHHRLSTRVDVATPGKKPIRGAESRYDPARGGVRYGPLAANGHVAYVNQTTTKRTGPASCLTAAPATATCPLRVTDDRLQAFTDTGGVYTFGVNTPPLPKRVQMVYYGSALLRSPSGLLSSDYGSSSGMPIPFLGTPVVAGAQYGDLVVGLNRVAREVHLSFWNAEGAGVGGCTARVGASTPDVAFAGLTVVFATAKGIYAVKSPNDAARSATNDARPCRAVRLVHLSKGSRLAGFELTSGGLFYAVNTGTKTVRGTVSWLTPKTLAGAGFRV